MEKENEKTEKLNDEERRYLGLLGRAVFNGPFVADTDEKRLIMSLAVKSGVLPFFFCEAYRGVAGGFEEYITKSANLAGKRYELMCRVTAEVISLLEADAVETVLLKGVALSSYYPVPGYRTSSDVDLLIRERNLTGRVKRVLTEKGYKYLEDKAQPHHISFASPEGVLIEVHTLAVRPFNNMKGRMLEELFHQAPATGFDIGKTEVGIFDKPVFALHVLAHGLEHYLNKGMGMKIICDILLVINALSEEESEEFLYYTDAVGLSGFLRMIVKAAYLYMGFDGDKVSLILGREKNSKDDDTVSLFMKDCLTAGKFGETSKARLVGNESSGIVGMIKQVDKASFENYPVAYGIVVIRPVLWIMSVAKFIKNNRTVRSVKTSEIIKSAGARGKISKKMNLWR